MHSRHHSRAKPPGRRPRLEIDHRGGPRRMGGAQRGGKRWTVMRAARPGRKGPGARRPPIVLVALAAGAAAAALAVSGCRYRVVPTPPAAPGESVAVHVLDYGHHTSLVLPGKDGKLREWFWGDWNYYALKERSIGSALRALVASDSSTLGSDISLSQTTGRSRPVRRGRALRRSR